MSHGRDRCLFAQTTRAVSQLTRIEHENSHLQSARMFQTTLVLRVHGRIHSTRVFPELVLQQVHRAPDTIFAAHVRGEMKHELRPVQVRGEIKPGNQATSHCSECADQTEGSIRTVRRARTQTCSWQSLLNKRGRCDNQESGTQHQKRIQHDTTRDVTPDEER